MNVHLQSIIDKFYLLFFILFFIFIFFSSNKCNVCVAIHFSFIEDIYEDNPKGSFVGGSYESFCVSFLDLIFETNGNGNSGPLIMFHTSLRPMSLHHSMGHCNTTNHIMFF